MSDPSEPVEKLAAELSSHSTPELITRLKKFSASAEQLTEIRDGLAACRLELQGWRREFEAIRQNGYVPVERSYLLNRAESRIPDLLDRISQLARFAGRSTVSPKRFEEVRRFLRWYREGDDGRELLIQTRKEAAEIDGQGEGALLASERDTLTTIVQSDERYFREYLAEAKDEITVYRGDGRNITATSLDDFVIRDVLPKPGEPDVSFQGVVEHTHTNTLSNGMVSTTTDQAQAIAWAVDDHRFGLVYEIRPRNYINVGELLRARNFKDRYAGQLEILIPGKVAAAEVVSVTLYNNAKAVVKQTTAH